MASGRPVVAYAAGGALETVTDGETGVLFRDQTAGSLAAALVSLGSAEFAPQALQRHAAGFGLSVFNERITRFIQGATDQHQSRLRTNYGIGPFSRPGAAGFPAQDGDLFNPFLRAGK